MATLTPNLDNLKVGTRYTFTSINGTTYSGVFKNYFIYSGAFKNYLDNLGIKNAGLEFSNAQEEAWSNGENKVVLTNFRDKETLDIAKDFIKEIHVYTSTNLPSDLNRYINEYGGKKSYKKKSKKIINKSRRPRKSRKMRRTKTHKK